jgi:hypothetical protein
MGGTLAGEHGGYDLMVDLAWGLDISNYQPRDPTQLIRDHGAQFVIPHLPLPWETIDPAYVADQIRAIIAAGCSCGGYGWCFGFDRPAATIAALIEFCARVGLILPILWLDCEIYTDRNGNVIDPGPNRAAWIREAFATCDALQTPVGIYTGAWWVRDYFQGGFDAWREFADRPHWVVQLLAPGETTPSLDSVRWGGGYLPNIVARQWSFDPVDKDIMLPHYAYLQPPEPEEPEEPEPEPTPDLEILKTKVATLETDVRAIRDGDIRALNERADLHDARNLQQAQRFHDIGRILEER